MPDINSDIQYLKGVGRLTPKSLPSSAFIPSGICCCTIRGGILIIPSRTR